MGTGGEGGGGGGEEVRETLAHDDLTDFLHKLPTMETICVVPF